MSRLALRENPTLQDLQAYVALLVEERDFSTKVPEQFMKLQEELGEFARAARKQTGGKFAADTHTAEIDEEAADVFILLLGLCNLLGVDLEQAFRAKEAKNKKREWK